MSGPTEGITATPKTATVHMHPQCQQWRGWWHHITVCTDRAVKVGSNPRVDPFNPPQMVGWVENFLARQKVSRVGLNPFFCQPVVSQPGGLVA